MNGEEAECALWLDRHPAIEFWVRNIERRPESFSLQTHSDKFYPDFVCKLRDGRILVVEYKSELLWSTDDSREAHAGKARQREQTLGRALPVRHAEGEGFRGDRSTVAIDHDIER